VVDERRKGAPATTLLGVVDIQPELWISRAAAAVAYYQAAFGAVVVHQVGEGDDIVAQLAVGDAAFWVSTGGADGPRFSPEAISGATGRIGRPLGQWPPR
jgi:PhnB protein